MADEKDRLGDKLHDLERAREDVYAKEHDKVLLEKLRQKQAESGRQCPLCHTPLVARSTAGVEMLACPSDGGAWLDKPTLERLLGSSR